MIFAIYLPKIPKKSVFFVDFHIDLSFEENWNGPEVGIDKETHGRELGQLLRRERPILSPPRVKLLPGTRYTVSRQKREDRGDQHGGTVTFGLNRPKLSQLRISKSGKLVWVPTSSRVLSRLISRRAGSISSLYRKTILKAEETLIATWKKKSRIPNGLKCPTCDFLPAMTWHCMVIKNTVDACILCLAWGPNCSISALSRHYVETTHSHTLLSLQYLIKYVPFSPRIAVRFYESSA